MKKITAALIAAAMSISSGIALAEQSVERAQIESVLSTYETALNTSNTDSVMTLYAEDGVFMPQQYPPAVGAEEVRAAYDTVFSTIKLKVAFDIVEVVQMAPDWAFARTNSAGTVKVLANGEGGPEYNKELFVLHRVKNGDWKIARYAFSATNPPKTN
jgi:uncharacterized protein (TIGR02246 family)